MRDPRVHFEVEDARQLPVANAAYDVVVSGLVLNFIPNLKAGMAEMVRVTKPGGTVAARMAAGPVVTEPGENPSPYRPTNRPIS